MRSQQRVARAFLLYFQGFDFSTSKIVVKLRGLKLFGAKLAESNGPYSGNGRGGLVVMDVSARKVSQ
jgi:hypothetical protein